MTTDPMTLSFAARDAEELQDGSTEATPSGDSRGIPEKAEFAVSRSPAFESKQAENLDVSVTALYP